MKTILSSQRHHYLATASILLIFSVTVVLTAAMAGCGDIVLPQSIEIQDWGDLNDVRDNLSGSYILMNDLDSSTPGYDDLGSATANGGEGWQPIGTLTSAFTGTFDGNGKTISDLFIYRPDKDEVGLFGRVQEGLIKNVGLVSADVTGNKSVGALVGYSWKGTLYNTYSRGSITGEEDVGGLAGNNYDGTVNQCESSAQVFQVSTTGPDATGEHAGGLVGLNGGTVLNCDYNGEVNGDHQVGGLVGHNALVPDGRVEDCGGAYSVRGNSEVGGVAGRNLGALRRNSYAGEVNGILTVIGDALTALNEDATGNARSFDTGVSGSYVGGVVGVNEGTVEDCSADATVEGYRYVGGLAGANGGNVTGCNSTGDVTGISEVGCLVGYNTGTITNPKSTSCVIGAIDCGPLVGRNEGHIRYNLTISSTSGGSVTTPGETTLTYNEGEVIHLVATPDAGYQFVEWTGDVPTIANIDAATTTITMQGNYKITANFEAILHSTYDLICDVPEVIWAGEETMIPVTLKTAELRELGYDGVQIHVKVYPRAGDVTIKLDPWSFTNELYSAPFDLPADYDQTIHPLVYCTEPGDYTFTFSLVEALYGPVINNMTESITVSVAVSVVGA